MVFHTVRFNDDS